MSKPSLIALTGPAGSGKDLVAAMLRMVGYKRFGFADEVRREISQAQGTGLFPKLPDWVYLPELQTGDVWEKPLKPFMRQLLQWWGTEYRRAQDPYYWIKKLESKLSYEPRVVISDLRFLNEADWVDRWGGVIWYIDRSGVQPMSHVSETEMQKITYDRKISNTGDQQHLASQILEALKEPCAENRPFAVQGS